MVVYELKLYTLFDSPYTPINIHFARFVAPKLSKVCPRDNWALGVWTIALCSIPSLDPGRLGSNRATKFLAIGPVPNDHHQRNDKGKVHHNCTVQ